MGALLLFTFFDWGSVIGFGVCEYF